ncbi:MAG: nucleotidyltransferase family protein [Candidatus Omnitrophota bacterium]|nr:MAG: nucleotidyltransferase family protein [Candidatus Omnitrophota bacterium]
MQVNKFDDLKIQEELLPCQDTYLKDLCSQYWRILPCCDAAASRDNPSREQNKILQRKAHCVDLFELKGLLLESGKFTFKAMSWSMFPVVKKGDTLKISPARIEDIRRGDIAVYRKQDRLYSHRVVDKQNINGKQFIITRADSAVILDSLHQERIAADNILGKIVSIKRGKRSFPLAPRKATFWEKSLYRKTKAHSNVATMTKRILGAILTKMQSFHFYEMFGSKFIRKLTPRIHFEIAVPFSQKILSRVYDCNILESTDSIIFSKLKQAKTFYLAIKLNNTPIGQVSFLNRKAPCPHKGCWLNELSIRARFRKLGFERILLEKAKEVLGEAGIANSALETDGFFGDFEKSSLKKKTRHRRAHLIHNTEELLFMCARTYLKKNYTERAKEIMREGVDWNFFFHTALRCGPPYLFYNSLKTFNCPSLVPTAPLERLKKSYLYAVPKVTDAYRQSMAVLQLFLNSNIPVVVLKGPFLSKSLYDDIAARGTSADIDLLIERENREKARKILEQAGYALCTYERAGQQLWQYVFKKPASAFIDLHWEINPVLLRTERMNEIWSNTKLKEEEGIGYYELGEEELLLYLSVHFVDSAYLCDLRCLCDVNALLTKYQGALDWSKIVRRAKRWKLSNSLYATLHLSCSLLGSYVPHQILVQLRPRIFKRFFIMIFANSKILLHRNSLRRQLLESFLRYLLFQLLEAHSVRDYWQILFPPAEKMGDRSYFQRFARGITKFICSIKNAKCSRNIRTER